MGTLTNQPERTFNMVSIAQLESIVSKIKELVREHELSTSEAIEIYKIAANQNLTRAKIEDWNIKDEQLAGFGEILTGIRDAIENSNEKG